MPEIWDRHWGYVQREGLAPLLLGEFGGRSVGEDTEGIWQRALVSYLRENEISYTYWTLNPNSGDTGGILLDDWESVDAGKQALLSSYQFPLIGIESRREPPAPGALPTPLSQGTPRVDAATPTLVSTPQPETPVVGPGMPELPGSLSARYRSTHPQEIWQDARWETWAIAMLTSFTAGFVIAVLWWVRKEN
jgi:endoglucanase